MKRDKRGRFLETHGYWRSPTYRAWERMIRRCHGNHDKRRWYRDAGIIVCLKWRRSFTDFLADMGPMPEGLTLDRIKTWGNYEPGNARWATWEEQRYNTRRSYGIEEFIALTPPPFH
jgi:hypothetical protein